jgi:hypothetical protein
LLQCVLTLDASKGRVTADPETMSTGATVTVVGVGSAVRLRIPALSLDVTTSAHDWPLFGGSYSQYTFYGV